MTHSLYDSDLQFSTYSDIIFYLAAGLIILRGSIRLANSYYWISCIE